MITQLNELAETWWHWMRPMFCQVSVLILFITVIDQCMRKRVWPQIRYTLWLLVLVKLILPPTLSSSTSVVTQAEKFIPAQPFEFRMPAPDIPAFSPYSEPNPSRTPLQSGPITEQSSPSVRTQPSHPISGPTLHWQVYIMGLWLTGVFTLLIFAWLRIQHLRNIHGLQVRHMDLPAWFDGLLAETAGRLGLKYLPKVTLSEHVLSPAVMGPFRPVLVLPAAGMDRLTYQNTEHILLHELAHIKRSDLMFNTLGALLHIVYWFNPLLLLVQRRLRHVRELCCDATVAGILQEKTTDYRETILENAHWLLSRPAKHGLGFLGLVEDSTHLLMRLAWLEKKTWKHRRIRIATVLALGTVMSMCVLPMARATKANISESPVAGAALTTEDSSGDQSHLTAARDGVTLSFPKDRSMGEIFVRDPGPYSPGEYAQTWYPRTAQEWQRHADARGDVAVPAGKEVSLRVSTEACADLSPLRNLPSDALTALEFLYVTLPGDQALEHVKHLTGTKRLTFYNYLSPTSEFLTYFEDWDSLEHVIVSSWSPSPSTLARKNVALLAGFKNLHTLELVNCRIPEECWPELGRLSQLKRLNLQDSTVGDIGLAHISTCRALEFLELRDTDISDEGLQPLSRLQNLEELGVGVNPSLCQSLIGQLAKIRGLKILRLNQPELSDADTEKLAELVNLEYIGFNRTSIGDETLARLANIKTLKEMTLWDSQITDNGLVHLKGMSQLEIVNLSRTKVTSAGLVHLQGLSNLRRLWLHMTDVTSAGLVHLQGLSKLELLGLSGTKVTSAGLAYLKGLSQLEIVNLELTDVTADGLAHLTSLPKLNTLRLPEGLLSDERTAGYLDKIPALKHAALLGPAVKAGDIERVQLLINKGVDIHAKLYGNGKSYGSQSTAVHTAAYYGRKEIASILLANGASVNAINWWKQTPLHLAAEFGAKPVAEALMAKGAHVNARDYVGRTPLYLAVDSRTDSAIVEFLIANGADVNAKDSYSGFTPLHQASLSGSKKVVELLLAKGARVNEKAKDGTVALHMAVRAGHADIVDLLLNQGADINITSSKGLTALHFAARTGSKDLIELLCARGADVNAKNARGDTPAHSALLYNRKDCLELLISNGEDVSTIHLAAYVGDIVNVKHLIEQGARVDAPDGFGLTPLHAAAAAGRQEVADFLIRRGASANAGMVEEGLGTPLHYATGAGSEEVVELLIDNGGQIDAKNTYGATPLHMAAGKGYLPIVKLLLTHGGDVNAKDGNGKTPLHRAVSAGYLDVVELLINNGADVNSQTKWDRFPLHLAVQVGNQEIVELLLAQGAEVSSAGYAEQTPIETAMLNGHPAIVKLLLSKGAEISPLHLALFSKDEAKVKGLIERGTDVNERTPYGTTPLLRAMHADLAEMAMLLVEKGAEVNAKDNWGWTPLHSAANAEKGNLDLTEFLISHGANVNAEDGDRKTPLWYAKEKANHEVAELLRKHGAK